MSYFIQLLIFSLLIFIVRTFNETCGSDDPPCPDPFICSGGYCLCSALGKAKDENNPLSFWAGEQCNPCPYPYTTSGTKCYNLILDMDKSIPWDDAREYCQRSGGDLLVIRSDEEFKLISANFQSQISSATQVKDCINFVKYNVSRSVNQFAFVTVKFFSNIWIGAKLTDRKGKLIFDLVAPGPRLRKKGSYWCSETSPVQQQPSYVGITKTGERQNCAALAGLSYTVPCMHNWFCSYDGFTACEIHPPPLKLEPEALEEKSNKMQLYIGIGGIVVVLLLASIGICCCMRNKTKSGRRGRSSDTIESGIS